jgi:hypothetical protein
MPLTFDARGHLTPYQGIESTVAEVKNALTWTSWREALFNEYLSYSTELVRIVGQPVHQWLDGSFFTRKERPRDLDLVTFVPVAAYENTQSLLSALNKRFKPELDAYFVKNYPPTHPSYFLYVLDSTEWQFQFSTSRPHRADYRKYPKGFVQLLFSSHESSL